MYIHRDAAQQNIWQIRIAGSVRPAQEASLSQGCRHAALVCKETRFDLCAMPCTPCWRKVHALRERTARRHASRPSFRVFFRSHPSRADFPGLSPHTFVWEGRFHAQGRAYAWCPKLPCRRTCSSRRRTWRCWYRAHDIRPWQSCPLRQTSGLDLVFRKPWLLHGSLLGMVYQKSPVLVCTILREGYIFILMSHTGGLKPDFR